jgi:hypothetical protein
MERNDHEPGVSGDGGLTSSINDLAKFDRDFCAGSSAQIWKPQVFRILYSPGTTRDGAEIVLSDSGSPHYGGGLIIGQSQGQEWIMHAGAVAGFRSQYIRLPQLKLGVAILCNRSDADPGSLAIEIVKTVARDELKGKTPKSKPAGLDPFAVPKGSALALSTAKDITGAYRSDDVGARFDITCRGSVLELALVWDGTGRKDKIVIKDLKQAGKDKLVQIQMGFILQLERNDQGVVLGFTYSEQRARGLRFTRISN